MRIGLIGDHISDIYVYGEMKRFSPESPIPIFDKLSYETRPGGAGNVNNNLIALGAYVDYFFDRIDYSVKIRYVCDSHIMFRMDEDKYSNLDPDLPGLSFPEETKYVILSDYNKGVLKDPQTIIKRLQEQDKIVVVDPKKDLEHYRGADIIKLNEAEYARYAKVDGNYFDVLKEYEFGMMVVTKGAKGYAIVEKDIYTDFFLYDQPVADVTGAGDIFLAAMTYYLAKGKNIYNACDLASKLASLSVTKFGTYCLTHEDIKTVEKKIVFTNGCFDIIHPGHIDYLRKSKKLGDKLIVGLNSDASVSKLKGDDRPINNQEDRKKVLEALEFVDEVIIFDDETPYELIKRMQPDIITKGGDYEKKEDVVGHDLTEVVIIPYLEGYSTTKILESLNADC